MKLHHLAFTERSLQKKRLPSVLASDSHSQAEQEPEHHEQSERSLTTPPCTDKKHKFDSTKN